MTVDELIEKLQALSPEDRKLPVCTSDQESGDWIASEVQVDHNAGNWNEDIGKAVIIH